MESNTKITKSVEVLIHVLGWGVMFGFPFFFMERSNEGVLIDWRWVGHHAVVVASFMVAFYVNYSLLVPKLLRGKKWGNYLVINFVLILLISLALHFFHKYGGPPPNDSVEMHPHAHTLLPVDVVFFFRDFLSMVVAVGLGASIKMSLLWNRAENARREAEKNRTEAELSNLRNQLNPHFLLNTLNNIYALIAFDTEKAQQAVQDLGKLLRYVLYENQETYVPLTQEIDFLKNYVELMRIRLTDNVAVTTNFQVSPQSEVKIAPLIFISLIENAFKHGVSPTAHSFIDITIREDDNKHISCLIRNTYYPKNTTDKSGSGIGQEQVRKRLDLLYADRYTWHRGTEWSPEGQLYISELTLEVK